MTEQFMYKLGGRAAILRGVDRFADGLKVTLGPKGGGAESNKTSTAGVAADGIMVSKEIELADPFENMGAQMVREVVSTTSKAVGDGTMTATVLAQAMFRGGVTALQAGADAERLKRGIGRAVRAICGYNRITAGGAKERVQGELDRLSMPVDDDMLVRLGAVSAGNERATGLIAAEAVKMAGSGGAITVEDSRSMETTIERADGLQFDCGYLSPYFVTDPERMECVLDGACLLICEQKISAMRDLLPVVEAVVKAGKSLLVIAADVSGEALATMVVNNLRGVLRCAAVKAPGDGEGRGAAMKEIAVLTGGKVVGVSVNLETVRLEDLGRAERIVISASRTTIVAGGGKAELEARVEELRASIEQAAENDDPEQLRERFAKLERGVIRIKVGAATETEMKGKKARVENAVRAATFAAEEGVVAGGGAALLRSRAALDDLKAEGSEQEGINIVKRSLAEPLRIIAQNSGHDEHAVIHKVGADPDFAFGFNAQTGTFGDLAEEGILDSVKVMRAAVRNAASAASVLLTAEPPLTETAEMPSLARTAPVPAAAPAPGRAVNSGAAEHPAAAPFLRTAAIRGVAFELPSPIANARYVNVCFTKGPERVVVSKTSALAAGAHYQLRLNIGRWRPESAVENSRRHPFPSELLPESPEGHWIQVIAVSDEFKIGRKRHALFLPKVGESWVCSCRPGGEHQCREAERAAHLFIPLTAPRPAQGGARESAAKQKPFMASLRLGVYYQNNLIQSQFLRAEIARRERTHAGYRSRIDYTLTAALSDVGFLPHRALNILTNKNLDGSHKIVINGQTDDPIAFNLSDGQMRDAVGMAREAMRTIHVDGKAPHLTNKYDNHNAKPKAAFIKDLEQLAFTGWRLFTVLFQDKPERRRQLRRALLREPSTIQVARIGGSGFVFPWAFIYDISLESDSKTHVLCPLLKEWNGFDPLVDCASQRCPFEGKHTANTLCPFGFWGFRHIIESPPSAPQGRALTLKIPISHARPEVVLGLSLDLDQRFTDAHLKVMQETLTNLAVLKEQSRDSLRDALDESKLELVYFYCHARREQAPGAQASIPFLEVGKEEKIYPSDITAWDERWSQVQDHWKLTSPLVFINGCHTAELTPDALVNFVDAFAGVYAAGVIGTEVIIHQQVANEAAEQFFERFLKPMNVGAAISEMRLRFLSKGNLMGLAYTPYCSADLELSASS